MDHDKTTPTCDKIKSSYKISCLVVLAVLVQCFEWDVGEGGVIDMSEGGGLSMPMATPLSAVCQPRKFVERMLCAST